MKANKKSLSYCLPCQRCVELPTFSFPNDDARRSRWAAALDMDIERVFPSDKLCIQHFNSKDIIDRRPEGGRMVIKKTAIPFINKPLESTHHVWLPNDADPVNLQESLLNETLPLEDSLSNIVSVIPEDSEDPLPDPIEVTTEKETTRTIYQFRYIGDFQNEDMKVTKKAELFYYIATEEIKTKRTMLEKLKRQNYELNKRILRMKKSLTLLKNENRKLKSVNNKKQS